jgi:hypothetical protein
MLGRTINVDEITSMGEKYLFDKIKFHFGKEFKLKHCSNLKESVNLKAFLKKYDKSFEKHITAEQYLTDFMTICKLDKKTYMYIATGRFIPAKIEYSFMQQETEDVYIYIFGRKSPKYWKELEEVQEKDSTKDKGGLIFNISKVQTNNYNITSMDLTKRSFDQLYFSHGEVDKIKDHLNKFQKTFEMYKSKQLSYKTGILLYGAPGTGKTSLAKAIATEYNRSIAAISVSTIADIDFAELATMINNDTIDTYIVLFEDIDTINNALSERDTTKKTSGKKKKDYDDDDDDYEDEAKPKRTRNDVMNALMQFLDGVNSPNNVIFVATTNYVDTLDEAFTRSGRFDLKIEIEGLKEEEATKFIKSFGLDDHKAKKVLEEYRNLYPDDTEYNQAKIQGITIKNMEPDKDEDALKAIMGEAAES